MRKIIVSLCLLIAVLAVATAGALLGKAAMAAESATSFYLLGSKGSMAGVTPPPGFYINDLNYYYSGSANGSASRSVTLRQGGGTLSTDIKVNADAYYQIPTGLWILPTDIMGGHLGFSLSTPIGWKDIGATINASAAVNIPALGVNLTRSRSFSFPIIDLMLATPSAALFWVGTPTTGIGRSALWSTSRSDNGTRASWPISALIIGPLTLMAR